MMFRVHDEDEVFRLAISAVPSLGPFRVASTYADPDPEPQAPRSLAERWTRRNPQRGGRCRGGRARHLGMGLRAAQLGRVHGYLVVVADGEPSDHEQFLLKALMHQTAAAMSNAAMYHDALETTEHVRVISEERAAVNDRLQRTVAEPNGGNAPTSGWPRRLASDGVFGLVEAL